MVKVKIIVLLNVYLVNLDLDQNTKTKNSYKIVLKSKIVLKKVSINAENVK